MRPVEYEVHIHVAALAATITDRRGAGEIPDSGLETEVAFGQRTNGTDIHNVRGVTVVELASGVDPQLRVIPAIEDSELAGLRDLVGEAHAPGTEDATLLVQHHVRAQCDGLVLLDLLLPEPRVIKSEVQIEILQVALTGLIAYRAVERVIGQQEFEHRLPAVLGLLVLRVYDHPFGHRCIACDLKLWNLFNVHETDAAVAGDRQCGVVAVTRNENPQLLSGLNDRCSVGNAYLAVVDGQLRHAARSPSPGTCGRCGCTLQIRSGILRYTTESARPPHPRRRRWFFLPYRRRCRACGPGPEAFHVLR